MPSACCCFLLVFLHRMKSIPNGVQMQQNFLWNFYGPEDIQWAGEAPVGCLEGGTTHQGTPGPPSAPWWVLLPSSHLQVLSWPTGCLLAQKKASKSLTAFGIHFVLISCGVKNMQKTTTSTGHYDNRLVPKNDIQ